jgi:glycosyltransferase involved in cell wall biosynthesis
MLRPSSCSSTWPPVVRLWLDRPNIREVLTEGVDALLVAPDGLAVALDRVLQDDALRRRLGVQARETVARRNLTWVGNAARIVEIANELLGPVSHSA